MRVDIQWAAIQSLLGLLLVLYWLEKEDRHGNNELHGVGLTQAPLFKVPSSAFQKHALQSTNTESDRIVPHKLGLQSQSHCLSDDLKLAVTHLHTEGHEQLFDTTGGHSAFVGCDPTLCAGQRHKMCLLVPHLDVDTFLWRLLQLTLIYVDYAVLKGQAVDGDAVPPRSCLQAPIHMLRQRYSLCPVVAAASMSKAASTGGIPPQGCTTGVLLQVKILPKVACSNEWIKVRIRNVIAACARVVECDLENCSEEGCWVGEAC